MHSKPSSEISLRSRNQKLCSTTKSPVSFMKKRCKLSKYHPRSKQNNSKQMLRENTLFTDSLFSSYEVTTLDRVESQDQDFISDRVDRDRDHNRKILNITIRPNNMKKYLKRPKPQRAKNKLYIRIINNSTEEQGDMFTKISEIDKTKLHATPGSRNGSQVSITGSENEFVKSEVASSHNSLMPVYVKPRDKRRVKCNFTVFGSKKQSGNRSMTQYA